MMLLGYSVLFSLMISPALSKSDVCNDKFLDTFRRQCMSGDWQQKFYFDKASMTCRLFWYDGCPLDSRNVFNDLLTCQSLCEEKLPSKQPECLKAFDEHYRDECGGGEWLQYYYYDKSRRRCIAFWYGGCKGPNRNIFASSDACSQTCEDASQGAKPRISKLTTVAYPITIHATARLRNPQAVDLTATLTPINEGNVCDTSNPCENNGTCVYDYRRKTYYCKCAAGYTNDNCTERIDYDPCAARPCLNGATCSAKAAKSKTAYECFCAKGFGGMHCEHRPCDVKPCKNGGVCRTTRGIPAYFCECPPFWGGKECDILIPEPSTRTYGKKVQLLSSGKAEWIEDLRRRQPKGDREMTGNADSSGERMLSTSADAMLPHSPGHGEHRVTAAGATHAYDNTTAKSRGAIRSSKSLTSCRNPTMSLVTYLLAFSLYIRNA